MRFLTSAATTAALLALRIAALHHAGAGADPRVEVVVSAFMENLEFVEPMLARVPNAKLRLKCSGDLLNDTRCEHAADLGDENAVFLKHIIDEYDQLPDVTVFAVGSIMKSQWEFLLCRKLNYVLAKLDTPEKQTSFSGFATMDRHKYSKDFHQDIYISMHDPARRRMKLCAASVSPMGLWFEHFVEGSARSHPNRTGVSYNDVFAVSRERLRSVPRATYQALFDELSSCGSTRSAASHFMERTWLPMLSDPSVDAVAGEDDCPIEGRIREVEKAKREAELAAKAAAAATKPMALFSRRDSRPHAQLLAPGAGGRPLAAIADASSWEYLTPPY